MSETLTPANAGAPANAQGPATASDPATGSPADTPTTGVRIAVDPNRADLTALADWVRQLDAADAGYLVLADDFESGYDGTTLAAWLGPATTRLVVVPEVPLTHEEPFHTATSTATVDFVTEGRAAWAPTVQTTQAAADLVGRRDAATEQGAWAEAGQIADVVDRLWLSWEPDAIIRDEPTGRFIDRDKVHYVDFTGTDSVGETFTVKGPSIVPRSPQGRLPTVVTVREGDDVAGEAAAALADIVLLEESAAEAGAGVRILAAAEEAEREPVLVRLGAQAPAGEVGRALRSAPDGVRIEPITALGAAIA